MKQGFDILCLKTSGFLFDGQDCGIQTLTIDSKETPLLCSGISLLEQVKRNVHDHVFLAANHTAPAQFDQDVQGL